MGHFTASYFAHKVHFGGGMGRSFSHGELGICQSFDPSSKFQYLASSIFVVANHQEVRSLDLTEIMLGS